MTNEQLIKDLIKKGEGGQLEFKELINREVVAKTICGFLNNDGGQILLGVRGNGNIIGIPEASKREKELRNYLLKSIVPEAAVTISVEQVGKKDILMIKVWGGSKKPYVFSGNIFYRRGAYTVQASSKELSELIHNRQQSEMHWERQPVLGAELDDLDDSEIRATIRYIQESGRGKEKNTTINAFLSFYGLYQNGNITNAAMILFGKEPTRFIPQARVRFSVLSGGKTGAKFVDDHYLEGNLFKNIEAIQDLLKKNISFNSSFSRTLWRRTDGFFYPMPALREGVLNALVHRNYSNPAGTATIILYPDKLEISNYGKLPHEITLADLKKNHLSLPNNPDIAHICFLKGYIEKIGRGTLKIIEACKHSGLKEPKWNSEANTIKLTFFSKVKMPIASDGLIKGITEGINKEIITKAEGIIEGITEGITGEVKDKLIKIFLTVYKNEGIRANDIERKVEMPVKSIERYIKHLKNIGLIEYKGAKRSGGYHLTKEANNKLYK